MVVVEELEESEQSIVPCISEDEQGWIYRAGVEDPAPVLRTGCTLETYRTMVVQDEGRPTAVGAWHWPGALGTVCAVGMYSTMHVQ
jgi:hypothetical protein